MLILTSPDTPPFWLAAISKDVRLVASDGKSVTSWAAPGKGKSAAAVYSVTCLDLGGEQLAGVLTQRGTLFLLDLTEAKPNVVELPLPVRPLFRALRKVAISASGMLLILDEEITLSRLLRPGPTVTPVLAAASAHTPSASAAAAGGAKGAETGKSGAETAAAAAAVAEPATNLLFRPGLQVPERPSGGLLKGLLAGVGGTSLAARESLFAGLEKKHDTGVQRTDHRAPNALDQLRQRMNERAERLSKFEDQAEQMNDDAARFGDGAHALAEYYKNKKWWQL